MSFVKKVSDFAEEQHEVEMDLGEVPDEFLCPLMSALLEDPVILPGSELSVERAAIQRHLLTVQEDPFTRQPLTVNMLKPDDALRERVCAWKQEKVLQRDKSV